MKQRLEEAFNKKHTDINNYVWKYEKVRTENGVVQNSVRLVDCNVSELKKFYEYCDQMLNNGSKNYPGRYVLLDIVKDQVNRCNTELFLRWLQKENHISKFSFMNVITTFLNNNPTLDRKELVLDNIIGQCPYEFKNLSVDMVLDGCMDTLGLFYKKYITTSFLLRQGVWPNEKERFELKTQKQKLTPEFILEYLEVNPKHQVRINSKGLSLEQMKSVTSLKNKKYSEMSMLQLETLRNRVLYALENEITFHIKEWEERKRQIKQVLESKGYDID